MSVSRPTVRGRGQPLVVLSAIMGGWLALRVLLWQPLFGPIAAAPILGTPLNVGLPSTTGRDAYATRGQAPSTQRQPVPGPTDAPNAVPLPSPWRLSASAGRVLASPPGSAEMSPARRAVGQQLLLAAAFAHMDLPLEIAAYLTGGVTPSPQASGQPLLGAATARPYPARGRWSGDIWLFLRQDKTGPLGAGQPSYGRSQAGAVLRYSLAPSSRHRPIAYARATRALAGPEETEVAAGLAARPLSGVPVSVAGEMRVTHGPAGTETRPAAFAVTELPIVRLPLGLRAEVYAQAGYVGGRYATAFADGQAEVEAKLASLGKTAEVSAGGGVWGGAQKHAARLDIGPTAMVRFHLGDAPSRVAIDYRVRVAGDAKPKSGTSVTFSAGF